MIDPELMSYHALSPRNVLVKHIRLWGKGKSQTSWGQSKEKEQTFSIQWGLAWMQKLIRLLLPADSLLWMRVWLWSGILRSLVLTTVTALLAMQKDNSILAVIFCLSGGPLNLKKFPWLHEDNCLCHAVERRYVVSLAGCPGRRKNDSLLLNLTKFLSR